GAGDSVRVGPGGFGHRERLDPARDLAWVQGRLVFDNCPLSEVLAELRRYYPGWIISTNAQLDRVAVTGCAHWRRSRRQACTRCRRC
ncbi:regulatory protein, partial [Pseudomonas syringae pv. actinidiae ICMP 19070]